jgi:hypothetical protein
VYSDAPKGECNHVEALQKAIDLQRLFYSVLNMHLHGMCLLVLAEHWMASLSHNHSWSEKFVYMPTSGPPGGSAQPVQCGVTLQPASLVCLQAVPQVVLGQGGARARARMMSARYLSACACLWVLWGSAQPACFPVLEKATATSAVGKQQE